MGRWAGLIMLPDHSWKLKYTPEHGNLVDLFYVPALEDAQRYDRLTGYFSAGALALAARGIEGLVRNDGRMRLLVGCTLEPPEVAAIRTGEQLRERVRNHLHDLPLAPPDAEAKGALELLAWMVAHGHLEVKVAVPCDADRKPISDSAIFHEKTGIIEDRAGNRIAWSGSLNETAAGWQRNWESINVFTSWSSQPDRIDIEDRNFARLWADKSTRLIVLDVPAAVRQDLLRYLPDARPERLKKLQIAPPSRTTSTVADPTTPILPEADRRTLVWNFLEQAPRLKNGGTRVGEATAAVEPWPHQVRAFERLYAHWPPKLLIADEVGLGKTIQAGMLLRQVWISQRAKRILILAPKAVVRQWQVELREKFNLNWPIYDGHKMLWYPSPSLRGNHEREVDRNAWHKEPVVIASSHLIRRSDRAESLLEEAQPWDLVVLDEAHHARRRAVGTNDDDRPNTLLRLMRVLKDRTQGLILLTATPMQVHPIEVWDLLNLLGLPPEWTAGAFLTFFEDIAQPSPTPEAWERMARLYQATERDHGEVARETAERLTGSSSLRANQVLRALRDRASIPRRQLGTEERQAALKVIRAHTPIRRRVSRHTRELLRRHFESGNPSTPIATRHVEDRFLEMTDTERALYDAVNAYITSTYMKASSAERPAIGFVMTIYRRRLASSFQALHATLERRLDAIKAGDHAQFSTLDEDMSDDETMDESQDEEKAANMERQALRAEESTDIEQLLDRIRACPPDSKLIALTDTLAALREKGYGRAMVFTQYTDTMDFLRDRLLQARHSRLMCFSGRGGEIPATGGVWRAISRDEAKRRFRDGEADIMLCTDAAAEGLNFQFCGALVNYDLPWNPMRVEQRIGRIDRVGQAHGTIRIVNLHYEATVETDIYRALRSRIDLFQTVVGRLQPILARLPTVISKAVLCGSENRSENRVNATNDVEREFQKVERQSFDIDAVLDEDLVMPERMPSPVTMEDLDRILASPALMPPETEIKPMGRREYKLLAPGMLEHLRVTTDPAYYEQHAESVELWSPGNPLFRPPEFLARVNALSSAETLKDILDR